jgi:hypothetical protein
MSDVRDERSVLAEGAKPKVFEIYGYWVDTKESIDGYLVTKYEHHDIDDQTIFHYDFDEEALKLAMEQGEDFGEFCITGYEEV